MKNLISPPPSTHSNCVISNKPAFIVIFVAVLMLAVSTARSQINSATSWSIVGNHIFSNVSGNVGIGTTNPQYKLDVIGDVRFSNNVYVGGGVIITEKVQASHEVSAATVRADSIKMDSTRAIYGTTRIEGDLEAKFKLNVMGDATFSGTLRTSNGLMFDNDNGLHLSTVNSGSATINYFTLGKILPVPNFACPTPNVHQWFLNNGGGFVSAQVAPTGAPNVNAGIKMYCAQWNGSGFIEVEGKNENGIEENALFVNYFCGRDAHLCVNDALPNQGGKVYVGKFLRAAQHVEIGDPVNGINSSNSPGSNVALDLHVNTGKAIKVRTIEQGLTAFEIQNTAFNGAPTVFKISGIGQIDITSFNPIHKMINLVDGGSNQSKFAVDGNGWTQIGKTYGTVNSPLTVTGASNNRAIEVRGNTSGNTEFLVTNAGTVYAREIRVKIGTLPDYVFEPFYKLRTLNEVETYYKQHKHLPDVPSQKEVQENDMNLGEMNSILLKKIEELTIYLVEQQKEIDELRKQIKNKN